VLKKKTEERGRRRGYRGIMVDTLCR
jgi:hypothetical protein